MFTHAQLVTCRPQTNELFACWMLNAQLKSLHTRPTVDFLNAVKIGMPKLKLHYDYIVLKTFTASQGASIIVRGRSNYRRLGDCEEASLKQDN